MVTKELCDGKCNTCGRSTSQGGIVAYVILSKISLTNPEIIGEVNKLCPNYSVCPECYCDDFTHIEGCELARRCNLETIPTPRQKMDTAQAEVPFNSEAYHRICEENHDLCYAKHQDYGKNNMEKFGEMGITMRIWEKAERLYNLVWKKKSPAISDEKIEDVFCDLANYCIIAKMIRNGEWQ